jgi:HAD superfamily 5'-nucleotidase-like hydrolase
MAGETFAFADYDCVGFDLDNTLCEYRIKPMVQMIYDVLAEYLISRHDYAADHLRRPIDFEFCQRGLVLDVERGNVLKIDGNGRVLRATHGTRFMSDHEIVTAYGPTRTWSIAEVFARNFLDTWNGPMSERIRPLLDFFDISVSLVFGRCVDGIDDAAGQSPSGGYNVWPDVHKGLLNMYTRDNFSSDIGEFFPNIKSTPSLYYNRCPEYVIDWLKELKRNSKVFLVSGSHVDYANFSAVQSLGTNWKELFDIAVFYARKPGFFSSDRPFYSTDSLMSKECDIVEDIHLGNIYSQGNWNQLYNLFKKETGKSNPKCLYVGDNVLQDIVAPSKFCGIDTIAVIEEMKLDCNNIDLNPDIDILRPNKWSSYFVDSEKNDVSIWSSFITHGKLCVPSIKCLAKLPVIHQFTTFSKNKYFNGFYPCIPNSLYKILK